MPSTWPLAVRSLSPCTRLAKPKSVTCGWLCDYVPKRYLLSIIYFTRAEAIFAFISFPVTPFTCIAFGATMGLMWLSTVPPTNGLIAGRNLIRVSVARTPEQAVPVSGGFVGMSSDFLSLRVNVTVAVGDAAVAQAAAQ